MHAFPTYPPYGGLHDGSVPHATVGDSAAERWTSAQIKDWSPGWRDNLTHWLDPNLALVGDVERGGQCRDIIQLPVQDPLAWANRRIELADGQWAIAGIRFRGRDFERLRVQTWMPDGLRRIYLLWGARWWKCLISRWPAGTTRFRSFLAFLRKRKNVSQRFITT